MAGWLALVGLAMGVEKVTGTLEKGKSADRIVVGGDPTKDIANPRRLRFAMRAGVLHSIDQLRAQRSPQ